MTGAIRETNTEKLYQELESESLQNKRKLQSLRLFHKKYKDHTPPFLHKLILKNFQSSYSLRTTNEIPLFNMEHRFFKSFFFPSTIIEWSNLLNENTHLRKDPSISDFKQIYSYRS